MSDPREDKSLWTEDRIQEEITKFLPQGTYLVSNSESATWILSLVQEVVEEGTSREKVLWEVEHFDKRLALFEAYGRLLPPPSTSVIGTWSPNKHRPTPETVTRSVVSKEPDPEDLDPGFIQSVYEKGSS